MNHPSREEWMSYLYDELNDNERANQAAHLHVCPDCKTAVENWHGTMQQMKEWRLPPRRAPLQSARPVLKWAVAALFMLGAGVGVGRLALPATADAEKIRAAVEPSIRRQLQTEFAATLRQELDTAAAESRLAAAAEAQRLLNEFARLTEEKRAEELQAFYAALNKLDTQHVVDYASLRQELETVAVQTAAGLRQAQRQIYALVDFRTEPSSNNSPTE